MSSVSSWQRSKFKRVRPELSMKNFSFMATKVERAKLSRTEIQRKVLGIKSMLSQRKVCVFSVVSGASSKPRDSIPKNTTLILHKWSEPFSRHATRLSTLQWTEMQARWAQPLILVGSIQTNRHSCSIRTEATKPLTSNATKRTHCLPTNNGFLSHWKRNVTLESCDHNGPLNESGFNIRTSSNSTRSRSSQSLERTKTEEPCGDGYPRSNRVHHGLHGTLGWVYAYPQAHTDSEQWFQAKSEKERNSERELHLDQPDSPFFFDLTMTFPSYTMDSSNRHLCYALTITIYLQQRSVKVRQHHSEIESFAKKSTVLSSNIRSRFEWARNPAYKCYSRDGLPNDPTRKVVSKPKSHPMFLFRQGWNWSYGTCVSL